MVLFLLSKALYSGPADCDNKSSLMSNKCAVRMLQYWTFLTFQKIISTECPPASPTRDLKVASLTEQLSKGRERIRKNIMTYPITPMCSMLST